MIDTHAYLDFPNFEKDREEVISRAFDNGLKAIINIGVDMDTSKKSIALAERHKNIFATVGFHPEYFVNNELGIMNYEKDPKELEKLSRNKKVVAIGETGLDYFSHASIPITNEQKENQKKGFLMQIEIARELGLPVIVHCREAWDDLYEIIAQNAKRKTQNHNSKFKIYETKFVLHCYSGSKSDTDNLLKLPNVSFSFSGNITYPKPEARARQIEEVIKMIPLDKIMLDSDSPFLAPQEKRGQRNEPINVFYIAKRIGKIKGISISEVEKVADKNAIEYFDLKIK